MGYPNIKETYFDPNGGQRPKNGDRYRNPALADTYRAIARKGREGFYEGEIAQTNTNFIKEQGGYQAIYRDPETGFYHGASESRKDGQAVGY